VCKTLAAPVVPNLFSVMETSDDLAESCVFPFRKPVKTLLVNMWLNQPKAISTYFYNYLELTFKTVSFNT